MLHIWEKMMDLLTSKIRMKIQKKLELFIIHNQESFKIKFKIFREN